MGAHLHARIGPSSLARVIACPGSIRLSEQLPAARTSSPYAAAGTFAHEIAEMALRDEKRAAFWLGQSRVIDGFTIEADEEMIDAVQTYVDYVEERTAEDTARYLETRVSLDTWHVLADGTTVWGTADCTLVTPSRGEIEIIDYKHGAGVPVSAVGNPQLRAYAMGALAQHCLRAEKPQGLPSYVTCSVVQPRTEGDPVSSETLNTIDLLLWADRVMWPALEQAIGEDAPLAAGDHCRFCPALGACPEAKRVAQETARIDFDAVPDAGTAAGRVPLDTLDNHALANILANEKLVRGFLDAVREEAQGRIEKGGAVPGWKVVAKRGRRDWRSEDEAREALLENGVDHPEAIEKRTLLSPTQVQKKFPDAYDRVKATMVHTKSEGTTLAPDSDKRKAIRFPDAAGDFASDDA